MVGEQDAWGLPSPGAVMVNSRGEGMSLPGHSRPHLTMHQGPGPVCLGISECQGPASIRAPFPPPRALAWSQQPLSESRTASCLAAKTPLPRASPEGQSAYPISRPLCGHHSAVSWGTYPPRSSSSMWSCDHGNGSLPPALWQDTPIPGTGHSTGPHTVRGQV